MQLQVVELFKVIEHIKLQEVKPQLLQLQFYFQVQNQLSLCFSLQLVQVLDKRHGELQLVLDIVVQPHMVLARSFRQS